jgi:hypothetical protein
MAFQLEGVGGGFFGKRRRVPGKWRLPRARRLLGKASSHGRQFDADGLPATGKGRSRAKDATEASRMPVRVILQAALLPPQHRGGILLGENATRFAQDAGSQGTPRKDLLRRMPLAEENDAPRSPGSHQRPCKVPYKDPFLYTTRPPVPKIPLASLDGYPFFDFSLFPFENGVFAIIFAFKSRFCFQQFLLLNFT